MNAQNIYDTVKSHLLGMRRQSKCDGVCVYRDSRGAMCAAGVLIKDEHYSPELEQNVATENIVRLALILSGVKNSQISIVQSLQNVHDENDNWTKSGKGLNKEGKQALSKVALDYDLVP